MNFFAKLKLISVGLISFFIVVILAHPVTSIDTSFDTVNTKPPNLEQLYQPKVFQITSVPYLEDIERAYNSIRHVPNEDKMGIPIEEDVIGIEVLPPGIVPRNATETYERTTEPGEPINAGKTRDMYNREAAIRKRNSRMGFTLDQKKNSVVLASMDLNNLAQYESCVFSGAYGKLYDDCRIDLVVRHLNSDIEWIAPNVSIDKFCEYVMKAHIKGTWLRL